MLVGAGLLQTLDVQVEAVGLPLLVAGRGCHQWWGGGGHCNCSPVVVTGGRSGSWLAKGSAAGTWHFSWQQQCQNAIERAGTDDQLNACVTRRKQQRPGIAKNDKQ